MGPIRERERKGDGNSQDIPSAAAFAAFPFLEGSFALTEESIPAGEAENPQIGGSREGTFLGAQSRIHSDSEIEESNPPRKESSMAAPLYELQSILASQQKTAEVETNPELEGEKLPEDYRSNREGLQLRIRLLEDELHELRDSFSGMKKRDTKLKAFLDYVNVLGAYYMKNCKYYDQEGWCTNWFWNTKPNFENPDGSKVAVRRGEDGKYYIKPNVFICSLCNAATSKFWV